MRILLVILTLFYISGCVTSSTSVDPATSKIEYKDKTQITIYPEGIKEPK